jgi:uncharacterized protein YaiI (UPF0178 family)
MAERLKIKNSPIVGDPGDDPIPFTHEEIRASIKRRPIMAQIYQMGEEMGIVRIADNGEGSRFVAATCKLCDRIIPDDANYCPYCAEPVCPRCKKSRTG